MRFRDAPLCKFLIFTWILAAVFVWEEMLRLDFWNFIQWGLFGPFGVYLLLRVLQKGALKELGFPLSKGGKYMLAEHKNVSFMASALFSFAIVSGFFYAAVISGDWSDKVGIPGACFGDEHIHHWMTFGTILISLLYILICKDQNKFKVYSDRALLVGLLMAIVFGSFVIDHGFARHTSFWFVFGIFAIFYFVLGLVLRTSEVFTPWFFIFMVISIGVSLGIFLEGVVFGIPNLPGPLILYDPSGCGIFRSGL